MKINSGRKVFLIYRCLIIVFCVTLLVFCANCVNNKIQVGTDETTKNVVTTKTLISTTKSSNTTNANTDNLNGQNGYSVTFYTFDGIILAREMVEPGKSAIPPADNYTRQGYVFTGWDKDLNNIKSVETVKPTYTKVRDLNNVLALSASYGSYGDTISVPLQLCGKVDLCALDIRIIYDKSVLKFINFNNEDGDLVANYDKKAQIIHMNFISSKNVTGEVDLCDLQFKLISEKATKTALSIEIVEITKLDEKNNFVVPKYNLLNSDVYVLKK